MKNKILFLTFLSLAVLGSGCDKEPTTSQQMEKVKIETKDAASDMKDYTFAQRAEFTTYMQGQLNTINADLDQLQAKVDKSSDTVKAEAQPKIQALRDQSAMLKKQLDDAGNATESTWDSVKSGTQKAYDSLKDGIQKSRQWVSDKIAP
jgi:capsule polysaccharide export protein KpsE/RkpR